METRSFKTKDYFRLLSIIYFAILLGQVFFACLSLFVQSIGEFAENEAELSEILLYVVPVFFIISFLTGNFIFKKRLTTARTRNNLSDILADYRGALIMRYALLEVPSLFTIVAFLITGEYLFLAMAGFIILLFIIIRPTPSRAITDLELNPERSDVINDPEREIL